MPRAKPLSLDETQLRILSDPSRLTILSMLFERAMSITQLARALKLSPATVHHHITKLLQSNLVRQTRIEVKRNLVEKYYEMRARGIDSSEAWKDLSDREKLDYRVSVLGMLKGMVDRAIRLLQRRGTVEWEVGRLFLFRVPWRADAVQQVEEILQDAKERLDRIERKYAGREGDQLTLVITTLPS